MVFSGRISRSVFLPSGSASASFIPPSLNSMSQRLATGTYVVFFHFEFLDLATDSISASSSSVVMGSPWRR